MRKALSITLLLALSGCATLRTPGAAPVEVQILAINDFHGALEAPRASVSATGPDGATIQVPAGGAAHLATAVAQLRKGNPNSITVAAGDLTGGSPFASSQFLDEPAVMALNMIGLELNAVGNHEFDRGPEELLRLQNGGCEKHTARAPCRVDGAFPGAQFRYLAANVRTAAGGTLFPATAMRSFGKGPNPVRIGFIGLTLKETPTLVVPSAVASLRFEDEAETINALVPKLRAEGASAVVVLIHQGVTTKVGYNDKSCGGVSGDLLPILAKLDPGVDVVVSGHTHAAYVCDHAQIDPSRPFLLTSAGRNGMLVSDITLAIDPKERRVVSRRADNVIVQGEGYTGAAGPVEVRLAFPQFARDPQVNSLVTRYVNAAQPIAQRVVGRLSGPALRDRNASGESNLGNLVADAQLQATGAEIAFMNSGGLRADLTPSADGSLTYGQIYAVQPFGNVLQVKGMTGAQLRAVLEQQFASGSNSVERPNMLQVSRGFTYSYDLRRPAGQRIITMSLNGGPIEDGRIYRVAVSNFLAAGGDNFTAFKAGTDLGGNIEDVDAFEAYFASSTAISPPSTGRITRIDAPAAP
jgi:5'-nucleotidase